MIVVCEGCERRFQLDDSRIPATGARVRCKHCHHRFRVLPPGDAPTEAADASAAGASGEPAPLGAPSAAAPGQISAEDTLFGITGGGAPIDGDRSLFGSLVDDVAPAAPSEAADEASSGGLTQDLHFVTERSAEGDAPGAPSPGDDRDAEASESPSGAFSIPPPDESSAPPSDAFSIPPSAPSDGSSAPASDAFSVPPSEDSPPASDAFTPPPSDAFTKPPSDGFAAPVEASSLMADDEALSLAADDEALSLAASGPAREVSPEPDASTLDAAPAASGEPAEEGGGEGSWEFVDSELSLDAGSDEEASPPVAPEPESAGDSGDSEEGLQIDPGASHPELTSAGSAADDTPSLRAVGPGAGPDSAVFEMVEGEHDGVSLELESGGATPPASPGEASEGLGDAPSAAPEAHAALEMEAPSTSPEIGTAADWDRLAAEGGPPPAAEAAEPEASGDELSDFDDEGVEDDPGPDWPMAPDDLPQPSANAVRRSHVWLEHAGWALSLVLLLAVARGTVHIEPVADEAPPGQVEIAGLVAENVRGHFVQNARSGMLFVVSGELANRGGTPRTGREMRVVVLDENGFRFEGRDAPVGLPLSEARVRETPVGALEQQQARLAQTLGERTLAPGEGVSFQAILGDLPDGAVRFQLEPVPERAPGEARDPIGGGLEEAAPEAG